MSARRMRPCQNLVSLLFGHNVPILRLGPYGARVAIRLLFCLALYMREGSS